MKHVRKSSRSRCLSWEGGRLSTLAAVILAATVALSPGSASNAQIIEQAAVSPWPTFSACVSWRESHDNPRARNQESSSQGRWQFLDTAWRDGLAHMVRERLVRFGMSKADARAIRIRLQGIEIARWPAALQDVGHAEVIDRGGWRHWWLDGSRCNQLRGE